MITRIQINLLISFAKSLRIASINAQRDTNIGSNMVEIKINSIVPKPKSDKIFMISVVIFLSKII